MKTLKILLVILGLISCSNKTIIRNKYIYPEKPKCKEIVYLILKGLNEIPPILKEPTPSQFLSVLECVEILESGYGF